MSFLKSLKLNLLTLRSTSFFALGLLLLTSALHSTSHAQSVKVEIDGSSTVYPLTEAVAEEYQSSTKGKVKVTVGISGTGGGFKKFCRGERDVQNASRPIQTAELEACKKAGIKFFELPVAYDAAVVIVNSKNDWVSDISVADLKKIWSPEAQGKVMKWSDVNPSWPKEKLKLFGAGADSGTFDYFTEAVVGKAKSSRGDYTASEDDNTLITGVASDKFALGYVPYSYYAENKNKLKALTVNKILPSQSSVENGQYAPLSRPVFIYVSEKSFQKPEVKNFVEFYLKNAGALANEVKLVALPAKIYEMGQSHLNNKKMGTVFAGHSEVGLSIENLMKKESKLE